MVSFLPHVGVRRVHSFFSLVRALVGRRFSAHLWLHKARDLVYGAYRWAIPLSQLFAGLSVSRPSLFNVQLAHIFCCFFIDTWQYFLHRAMHVNTFLFKTIHS